MADVIKTTFKVKRGTAARWEELNPILNPGEPGFEMDTFKLKIGNGSTPWKELPYVNAASVQPDWNQNDETAADYVKNRPFYTGDTVETVLVEQNTVSFAEHNGLYRVGFPSTFEATVGDTYKVSWDGTVYECICENFNNIPVIGNLSIGGAGSDTGEPFLMGVDNGRGIVIATQNTAASHTFSISGFVSEVVKIDEKYLPDTVATKSEVEVAQSTANAAKTAAENAQASANNAVKYTASQNLTDAQKQQARTNIGAGTSSFSGNYNDLVNKPTIVQCDWDVNNDSDMAYIKNRTHYDYTKYTQITLQANNNPEASSLINDIYYYGEKTGSSLSITSNNIYKVSGSNGTTYISTCRRVPIPGQIIANAGRVLGNAQLGVDAGYLDGTSPYYPITDTGEPWCFISYSHTAKNAIISTISDFRISKLYIQSAHELKQLDEKYIPSTIAKTSDIPTALSDLLFKPAGKSYLTFSSPNSFTLNVNDKTKHWDGTLEYFASDKTWTVWNGTTTLSSVDNDGDNVLYLRGTGNTLITGGKSLYRWILTGSNIKCISNIENLLDYATVESGNHPTMANYCYSSMFSDCTSLTQAPELPATTLADNCYYCMFYDCTSLTQAPDLPATTLKSNCYRSMFSGCSSLTKTPALPATTLADSCYTYMFDNCTALTQAPALPATTLVNRCYCGMFYGCTSLIQAPALPATTLVDECYYSMFRGCTGLTQVPVLPAMTLAQSCYSHMFDNCTNLTKAPALPATTLAQSCYNGMFYSCRSLTQVPTLPATTLADGCYSDMFRYCTSLKLSSTQTGEYTQEYRIPTTGTGTTATDALTDMFTSTGGTFTGRLAINTTYYLSTDNMIVRDTEIATLNGYVGSMIDVAIGEYADTAEYIIPSSTQGSTKRFKITVDDSGTLTATEVT